MILHLPLLPLEGDEEQVNEGTKPTYNPLEEVVAVKPEVSSHDITNNSNNNAAAHPEGDPFVQEVLSLIQKGAICRTKVEAWM